MTNTDQAARWVAELDAKFGRARADMHALRIFLAAAPDAARQTEDYQYACGACDEHDIASSL